MVVRSGASVEGARVLLSHRVGNSSCIEPSAESATDQEGKFTIPVVERFRLFKGLVGDRLYEWHVCILSSGSRFTAHNGGSLGNVPSRIQLHCDLSALKEGAAGICS